MLEAAPSLEMEEEIERFRAFLFYFGLDQSTTARAIVSWSIFIAFTVLVPAVNTLWATCETCNEELKHSFHQLLEYSESAFAAVSFVCLTKLILPLGPQKLLLLDGIFDDSLDVRHRYEVKMHKGFRSLFWILLPCLIVELIHKVTLYRVIYVEFPFHRPDPLLDVFICAASVLAWLYKSVVFLFVCLIFRLLCSLQLLRLEGYVKRVGETSDVNILLEEHLRIRDQLSLTSHRFRVFLVLSIVMITCSQLYSLLVISDSHEDIDFLRAGDLLVCSVVQLSGFVICVYGAVKITHRAQEITSVVTQWHAVLTCAYKPSISAEPAQTHLENGVTSDLEAPLIESRRSSHQLNQSFGEFYKREALVNYLQHSKSGISLFGFVLDRGFLYAVFGIELTLTTFLLGETLLH